MLALVLAFRANENLASHAVVFRDSYSSLKTNAWEASKNVPGLSFSCSFVPNGNVLIQAVMCDVCSLEPKSGIFTREVGSEINAYHLYV